LGVKKLRLVGLFWGLDWERHESLSEKSQASVRFLILRLGFGDDSADLMVLFLSCLEKVGEYRDAGLILATESFSEKSSDTRGARSISVQRPRSTCWRLDGRVRCGKVLAFVAGETQMSRCEIDLLGWSDESDALLVVGVKHISATAALAFS
jgi:hypothetical protein